MTGLGEGMGKMGGKLQQKQHKLTSKTATIATTTTAREKPRTTRIHAKTTVTTTRTTTINQSNNNQTTINQSINQQPQSSIATLVAKDALNLSVVWIHRRDNVWVLLLEVLPELICDE